MKNKKKNKRPNENNYITFENISIGLSELQPFWPYDAGETRVGLRRVFGDTFYFTLETAGVPKGCPFLNGDGILFGWDVLCNKLLLVLNGIGSVDVLESDGVLFILYEKYVSRSYTKGKAELEVNYLERGDFCLDSDYSGWDLDKNTVCYKSGKSNAVLTIKDGNLYVDQSGNAYLYYRDVDSFIGEHKNKKTLQFNITVNFDENG